MLKVMQRSFACAGIRRGERVPDAATGHHHSHVTSSVAVRCCTWFCITLSKLCSSTQQSMEPAAEHNMQPAAQPMQPAEEGGWPLLASQLLPLVLSLLDPASFARSRAVCRQWHSVGSDPQVRKAAFLQHWGLLVCHGRPRHPSFFETATLSSFVTVHQVQRCDRLESLAVRHATSVHTLRRLNNLMTDHSLYSRTHVFIPVGSREQLAGSLVSFVFCPLAKRDFAVLQNSATDARGAPQQQQAPHAQHGAPGDDSDRVRLDVMQAKLCALLGRSLRVDDSTARFYLEDAGGDLKAAMAAFANDLAWEGTTIGPIRTAPVSAWIRGERGL